MRQAILQFGDIPRGGLLVAAVLFCITSAARADSSVWEVSNGETRLFLGGTIHALRPSDFPLPEEFDQAYAAADEVYFEVDIELLANQEPELQAILAELTTYQDGRSLRSELSEAVYSEFYAYAARFGVPPGALDLQKPFFSTAGLSMAHLATLGFEPGGVDFHFGRRAAGDGLPRGALETIELQIELLAGVGVGDEERFVRYNLEQSQSVEEAINWMIDAWRDGDIERIDELMLRDFAQQFPEGYEASLTRRNLNWLPQIMAMLEDADTEFVLVGVGHMPRQDGLLELLRGEGATVRPFRSKSE